MVIDGGRYHRYLNRMCDTNLNLVIEALEGLQLHSLEDRASRASTLLDLYYDSTRGWDASSTLPGGSVLRFFSFANVAAQLSGGEALSPENLTTGVPATLSFGLRNAAEDVCSTLQNRPLPTVCTIYGYWLKILLALNLH